MPHRPTPPPVSGNRGATLAQLESTQFKFWLDHAPDGILCTDSDGAVIYANKAILALLGYNEQEFLRLHVADTYDPTEAHLALTRLLAPELGAVAVCERRMRRKDGMSLPVEISYVRLPDGTVCGSVRNITRLKNVERRLAAELAVCKILNRVATFNDVAPELLAAIGETTHWDFAAFWQSDPHGQRFSCSHVWQRQLDCGSALAAESQQRTFARGEGVIGIVAETAQPMWISDIFREATFKRVTKVGKNQLRSACAVPFAIGEKVVVLELLTRQPQEYDAELLGLCAQLAAQIDERFGRSVSRL